jgi:alkanesulfonate monooxygenase SsuD/methylene tetrahydromethanopterin reductase-like flavin-dependent oxidoreductase (luciferase family)
MPSPEEALAHEYTPEQAAVVAAFKKLLIVGTPEQVRARIESVASRTEADEVMIMTHGFDADARVRSYELVAQVFGLEETATR